MAVEATVSKDFRIKLNTRIGFLKFKPGAFFFDNMPKVSDYDGITSCKTTSEFRANKQFLTNIRERRINGA